MSATSPSTLTGSWVADPIHSTAEFTIKHMVVSTYRTAFKNVEATLDADGDDIRLTGTVPVESIDIQQPDFRAHVLSPDFFDVEKNPTITFTSTSVRRGDGDTLDVDGDLTVKGVTKPVTVDFDYEGTATDPFGNNRLGLDGRVVINRKDWGVTWNAPLETGGVLVGEKVTLEFEVSAVKVTDPA
jgi:polyisoprenoid-binding protein YceI